MDAAAGPHAPRVRPVKLAEGREAEIFAWGEDRVLRLHRDPNAGASVDRELLALAAVREALPCVPAPHGRIDWEGRPGLLMDRIEGCALFSEIQRHPWRVWQLATLSGRVHADLHALRGPIGLPALRDALAERIGEEPEIPEPLRRAALAELARLPDGESLCHGDFHPDNVLLATRGPVVIDWPSASRGDPCGDLARTALMLRVGALPPGMPPLIRWAQGIGRGLFARAYLAGYTRERRVDGHRLRRWQLVRAIDRLADRIPEERPGLLRAAEDLLAELHGAASSRPVA